jgi:transcriptional regulator with XRE-family HTH domain
MPSTPTSSNAWQVRRELAASLGEIRRDAGLTGRALAHLCGWHESKVSRIENAVTAPSGEDIRAWCENCDARDQVADLIASLRAAEGMFVEWSRLERAGLRRAQQSVLPLWEQTSKFCAYSSWLLPGAVQIKPYTQAVLRSIGERRGLRDDVEGAVSVRTEKLRLMREGGRRFEIVVEEPVLRTVIGGPEVMAGQLSHLVGLTSRSAVSLGIIDDAQVNVELVSGFLTITRPREIAAYTRAFSDLCALAMHGANARALIADAINALR